MYQWRRLEEKILNEKFLKIKIVEIPSFLHDAVGAFFKKKGADSFRKIVSEAGLAGIVSKALNRDVDNVRVRTFAGEVCKKLVILISNLNFFKSFQHKSTA